MRSRSVTLALALLTLAGCNLAHPAAPRKTTSTVVTTGASPAVPGSGTSLVTVTTLTGKVKLLSNLLSNNGSGVVSNNSGTLISDNGGAVIANNGGGLVANNAGNRRLLDAAPQELGLADAVVGVYDAAGKPVTDAGGKAITATTDKTGSYKLQANLPAKNLVLRVKLGTTGSLHGGQLSAILPKPSGSAVEQGIDTASTLGASYVLSKFVHGDQATYDKLPGAEAEKLRQGLATASAGLSSVPSYDEDSLNTLVEGLRGQSQVGATLDEIQALLLGQSNLGDGRPATRVAIANPGCLALDAKGRVLIGEQLFGRIRTLNADGTMGTFADILRGEVKHNFKDESDLALAPDGSIYVAAAYHVYRIDPKGQVSIAAGGDTGPMGPVDVKATATTLNVRTVAVGKDGTLYIGEDRAEATEVDAPRLLVVGPDGILHKVPVGADWVRQGRVQAMTMAADGTLYFEYRAPDGTGKLYGLKPGATPQLIKDGLAPHDAEGGLAVAPDGTIYLSDAMHVIALSPDGTQKVVAGANGPTGTRTLGIADALLLLPDGTLLVADAQNPVVWALGKDGSWTIRAGVMSAQQGGNSASDLAISAPHGCAFDENGKLLVTQTFGRELELIDGGQVTPLLGPNVNGNPTVRNCTAVAYHDGAFYVIDEGNRRLLRVKADGSAEVLAGGPDNVKQDIQPGERASGATFCVSGEGLAISPDGIPYWSDIFTRQILRLAKDGKVELVVGKAASHVAGVSSTPTAADILNDDVGDGGAAVDATLLQPEGLAFDARGDLYIAEAAQSRIRKVTGLAGATPIIQALYGLTPTQQLVDLTEATPVDTEAKVAHFNTPGTLAFDAQGNLYVGDLGTVSLELVATLNGSDLSAVGGALPTRYPRIRRITPDGKIQPIMGIGSQLLSDPLADDALQLPLGLSLAADGRLAIVDAGANLVRILPAGSY